MKEYAYKESGIEWLGEIPEHWSVKKLKRVLDEKLSYGANEAAELEDQELPRYIRITDFDSNGSLRKDTFKSIPEEKAEGYYLQDGDILFARSGATVGKTFQFKNYNGKACFAGYLIKASPRKWQVDSDFLYFFTKSHSYESWKEIIYTQSTIQNIGADKYQYLDVPLPPLSEQKAIADYLDTACQKIDRVIELKEKQIEKIEGHFQQRVYEATTKGLKKNVEFKKVNSNWIGEIPVHWEVRKIKRFCKIFRGKFTHRPRNDPDYYGGKYPFIQTGSVTNADKYINEYTQTLNEKGLSVSELFPSGTLTMTIAANIGDVAILNFEACFPDSVVGFKPDHDMDIEYLFYLFKAIRQDFLSTAIVTTQLNLNIVRIGNVEGFKPPLSEQKEIVKRLNTLAENNSKLKERLKKQINILKNYRKSLIHECVTGKKRVYEVDLPKEAEMA